MASWGHLPRQEGVNQTYFTYDFALWRLQPADGGASIKSRIPAFFTCDCEFSGLNHTYFTYDRALGRLQLADGGLNHTYFMYDRALGRFHAAVGWVIGPTWVE